MPPVIAACAVAGTLRGVALHGRRELAATAAKGTKSTDGMNSMGVLPTAAGGGRSGFRVPRTRGAEANEVLAGAWAAGGMAASVTGARVGALCQYGKHLHGRPAMRRLLPLLLGGPPAGQ